MPKVQFSLEEQNSDLRSNEVSYKLTVENLSPSAVELLSLTPRIPEDVKLLEIRDPSLIELKSKHNDLCKELTSLLNNSVQIRSHAFREEYVKIYREMFKEMFAGTGILALYFSLFTGSYTNSMGEKLAKAKAFQVTIENYTQAQEALNTWLSETSETDPTIRNLYTTKLQWLCRLEAEMGSDLKMSSLATIEPESFFAVTYVLKFPRNLLNAKKYNIAIEGVYTDVKAEDKRRYVGGATRSLTVSPNPVALSTVAVIGSILGAVLNLSMNNWIYTNVSLFRNGLVASILALIFFNIYEFTDMGKNFGVLGIGWRSALFIGALCGIFGDRIMTSFKTLLGIA